MSFYNDDIDMDDIMNVQIYIDDIKVKLAGIIYHIKHSDILIAEAKIIANIANDYRNLTNLCLQRVRLIEKKLDYEEQIEHHTYIMNNAQSRMLGGLN